MLASQLREAITAAPRCDLPKVSGLLWKAYAAGQVTEPEASELSQALEARRVLPAPQEAPRRRLGSRPKTHASLERRRSWAASGWLPPQVASRFTLGECAALSVVAQEHVLRGRCSLPLEHIAALSGTSRSTAKRALAAAKGLG